MTFAHYSAHYLIARIERAGIYAVACALLVGAIADTVTGTYTTLPYQLSALAGGIYGLVTRS